MKKTLFSLTLLVLCLGLFLSPKVIAAEEYYELQEVSLSSSLKNGINVYLKATGDCTMMVAMYDSEMQMLACEPFDIPGRPDVQHRSVALDLKGREMAAAKVFLLDKATHKPLCDSVSVDATQQTASTYNITALRLLGDEAIVTCITEESCTLTVQVLSEDLKTIHLAETVDVEANLHFADVSVGLEGIWPQYYVVSAQLFDSDGNALCKPFYLRKHTQKFEQFSAQRPSDFTANLVLDMADFGFCVLVDNAKSATELQTAGEQITVSCSDAVRPGDVLLITEPDGEKKPILVETVSPSGTNYIVTADKEATISDIYKVVNLNASVDVGQAAQNDGEAQLLSLKDPDEWDDGRTEMDLVKMTHSLDAGPLYAEFSVSAGMVINVIYDADIFGEDYIETETYVDLKAEGSAEFSLACESTNLKDAFGNPKIPCLTIYDGPFYLGCFGLVSADLNITVPIEFKIGGSGKIAFEFSGKTGYIYDTANGSRDLSDYSATATAQLSAGFEVQAGPKVGLELQFSRGLLEGELSGGLGLILRGEAACPVVDITTAPKNHACKLCCDVDLSIYYRANASLGIDVSEKLQATLISIDLVSGEYALGKAYISIINDADSIFGGKLAAGEGFCPNYQYRVMIYTENEEQERLSGIPVAVFREGNAKAEGVSPFRTYLYDGDYTGLAYFDSATYPKGFTVDRGPLELTIREQKTILSGTVTDKATGEPIPGAAVRIVWEDDSTLTTTTNAEGCYRFSFYPNGKGSIQFEAENYLPKNTTLSLIAGAENTMDAQLANAYTVTVTVLGLDSGPLGNMPIHGTLLGQSPVTEADGTVSFALPGGSYTLSTYNNVSGAYADIVVDRDLEVTLSLEKNFMAWRFDEPTATLYIWGHGPMGNYYGSAPWEEHKAQIQVVNIKGLRSIGAQAFDKYPAITTVILSDTLETIGYEAFIRCEALKALKLGRGLQAVSDYAFQNCTALTALHLPDSTVTLNNCAFQNCSALAEVTFGEGLRTIGASVFSGSGVTSVILPKTLESTGNYAFSNCASLLDVYIPGCESGTTLCLQSFKDCKALSSVILGENVKTIGGDVFMNCTSLTYLDLGGVTSIGGSAFQSCSSLVALDLPHTLTNIGPSAFGYCSSLGSVAIPSSVTGMGNYAFQHSGMPSVVIPGNGEGLVIPYGAFEHCENLASVEIGNGVTRLANNSFGYCVSLSNLNLGSAVTELGDGAFRGCTGLKALTIPASVRSIGGSTFQDCTALTRIYLPVGLRSIGAAAFSGCTALTGVTIPDTVTLINNYAFSNCTGLRSLLVEGNALGTRVNLGSFQGCKALTSATLGEGVTTLGDNAFPGCESLTSVSLPASLETIGGSAFARTALHSVTIPNQVTGIGGSAFYYCEALSSVTIGSGVESIGPAAFSHTALTSVYVPESVKDIGNYAFERCASLSSVHIAGNPNGTGIHTCAFQWCDALSSVTLGDGVSFIANYAFEFCNKISSVSCSTWGSISIGDRGNDALIKAYGN